MLAGIYALNEMVPKSLLTGTKQRRWTTGRKWEVRHGEAKMKLVL